MIATVSAPGANLGKKVLGEYGRFRGILNNLPDRPGHGRYVEVNGTASIQGFASKDPVKEEGWFLHYRQPGSHEPGPSISVHYETIFPDQSNPEEKLVKRVVMYQKDDSSNPECWKLETWHRDTIVRFKNGEVLSDEALHTTAVYPGTGPARNGVIVDQEKLSELPLSESQQAGLQIWNIAT